MKKFARLSVFICTLSMLALCAVSCNSTNKQAYASQNSCSETYRLGTYTAVMANNMFDMDKAVRAVSKRAKFTEVSRLNKYNHIEYVYRDFYDNKLSITLWQVDESQTKIKISIGKFGDKKLSQEILLAIDEELRASSSAL